MFWHRRSTRLLGGLHGRRQRIGEGSYFEGSYGLTVWSRSGSGRWLWMATQTSVPLVRAGTPETNVGSPSAGQKKLGHGIWQRTKHAASAGMSTAWRSMARPAGEGIAWAALRWMVWGSGWAGMAVPWVTSMCTRRGRMMSIPINAGGDSRPTITMKLAFPLVSPHCKFRCCVFPAISERFPVGAVDDPLERLQGSPLGAVLPPERESHAGDGGSSVHEAAGLGFLLSVSWPVIGWSC